MSHQLDNRTMRYTFQLFDDFKIAPIQSTYHIEPTAERFAVRKLLSSVLESFFCMFVISTVVFFCFGV